MGEMGGKHRERPEDVDAVDADLDVGAPEQDSAVAGYLLDHPYGLRIDEIEDRGSPGIGDRLRREDPEAPFGQQDDGVPAPRKEDAVRVLRAEEFADRLRDRGV